MLDFGSANGPLLLSVDNTNKVIASPLTKFYNSRLARDFMLVSVSDACTNGTGGLPTVGCIRSLDITSGFPANANAVVLAATGGTGTITVDNDNVAAEASSVYYTTQTGNTIVKATQSALQ